MKLYYVEHRELLGRGQYRVMCWKYYVLAESEEQAIQKAQDKACPPEHRNDPELRQYFDGTWSVSDVEDEVMSGGNLTRAATDAEVADRNARTKQANARRVKA